MKLEKFITQIGSNEMKKKTIFIKINVISPKKEMFNLTIKKLLCKAPSILSRTHNNAIYFSTFPVVNFWTFLILTFFSCLFTNHSKELFKILYSFINVSIAFLSWTLCKLPI